MDRLAEHIVVDTVGHKLLALDLDSIGFVEVVEEDIVVSELVEPL